jgi:hypothetical protein
MEFDFTGANPRNPLVSFNPDPGPYICKIVSVDPNYNNGKSTKFEMDAITGPSAGLTISKYLGNDEGAKGGNKANWLQALACIAPDADAFLAKAKMGMKFDPTKQAVGTFGGKPIHVLVIEVPGVDAEGRPNLPNIEFITKAQYAQLLAAQKAGGKPAAVATKPATPAANGAPAPAAAATPGTPSVLDDLFAQTPPA